MYSEISIETVERFRMARYVVISPCPEDDVMRHMREWARSSGLLGMPGYTPKMIGWDFPFVSEEQKTKFGFRGYAAAYVIPEEFHPACEGAEIAYQDTDTYAKITVTDPFSDPFTKIQGAYQKIYDYSRDNGILAKSYEGRICMEEVYEKDGTSYMDVFVPVDVKNGGEK